MSISRQVAKPLCTATEFSLAEESFTPQINSLNTKELISRIQRTRRLRDKYRDVSERQTREILGRTEPRRTRPVTGKRGTTIKQQFFAETLVRFEKRLEMLREREKKNKAKQADPTASLRKALARKRTANTARPVDESVAEGKKHQGIVPITNDTPQRFPNLPTMRGAALANTARSQARRDNRSG